ncbi:MAG: hypothetical protein ACXWZR_20170 [Mycobacterium sp.]
MATFAEGSTFVEVGSYLGRSLCSLAEVVSELESRIHRGRRRLLPR